MKKTLLVAALAIASAADASNLLAKNGYVRFFSTTPIENIEGICQTAVSTLDLDSGKVAIKSRNTTYLFPDKLMQEHFNENYMESEKYPVSAFAGRVTGIDRAALDAGKTIQVTIDGDLDVHGVKKHYTSPGTLTKAADGSVSGETKFHVKMVDHGIKIPTVVVKAMAESMDITARFTWRPTEAAK
jgi:hypothetical protein